MRSMPNKSNKDEMSTSSLTGDSSSPTEPICPRTRFQLGHNEGNGSEVNQTLKQCIYIKRAILT
eukprot:9346249-Ditylum_brightwellii.AAC.1